HAHMTTYISSLSLHDALPIFKLVVKTIARKHNLHATFMPKPLFGVNGSGMHFNVSLFNGKENAFFDPDGDMQLTDNAFHFIAGIDRKSTRLNSSHVSISYAVF